MQSRSGGLQVTPLPRVLTPEGTIIAAGDRHSVLLQSEILGGGVAWGRWDERQTRIPPLPEGLTYLQADAGALHTVLLRSDGAL